MKVALLTYWGADNYGATLQAYATIKALKEIGHETVLINLQIESPINSFVKKILLYPKHLKFHFFRKKYFKHITQPYNSVSELQKKPPQAEYYIIGSDQTWNPDIAKDKIRAFFLDFGNKETPKITYAASFGKDKWENSKWISEKEVCNLLSNFKSIAIRETSGVEVLKNLGFKSIRVLDPVLLFDSYPEFVKKRQTNPEIILYKLVNTKEFYEKAKAIGKTLNLQIRSIGSIRKIKGIKSSYPESIPNWMCKIANCQYVITDSFHGTVISLLYKRQFVVCVGDPKLVTRIKSLLTIVGLEERIMNVSAPPEEIYNMLVKPINYDKISKILSEERKHSLLYLKNTIV